MPDDLPTRHRPAGLARPAAGQPSAAPVLHVRLNRPAKRNAISDPLIQQLHTAFVNLPEGVRAAVVSGEGDHFCAGLDLSELVERDIGSGVLHSRMWHAAFDAMQFGTVPVVAVLHGAVVGGGLELASRLPHPRGRRLDLLRPARRPARHLRRRRRLGAHPAPDGRGAHDRPDDDRPRLRRRRRPRRRPVAVRRAPKARAWPRRSSWPRASPPTRRCPTSP